VAVCPYALSHAESGEFTEASRHSVAVRVDGRTCFTVGQRIDITYMADLLEMLIGTYQVVEVKGQVLMLRSLRTAIPPSKGMKVNLYEHEEPVTARREDGRDKDGGTQRGPSGYR
jgi:hypothetical protein